MAEYSANEIVGATLYAKQVVTAYTGTSESSAVYKVFEPGETIGQVYSYVNHSDGVWWQFDAPGGGSFYVHHSAGYDAIADGSGNLLNGSDGVMTDQQQQQYNDKKTKDAGSIFSGFGDAVSNIVPPGLKDAFAGLGKGVQTALYVALAAGGLWVGYKIYRMFKPKK